jgi:hypothetical protein
MYKTWHVDDVDRADTRKKIRERSKWVGIDGIEKHVKRASGKEQIGGCKRCILCVMHLYERSQIEFGYEL